MIFRRNKSKKIRDSIFKLLMKEKKCDCTEVSGKLIYSNQFPLDKTGVERVTIDVVATKGGKTFVVLKFTGRPEMEGIECYTVKNVEKLRRIIGV